MSELSTEQKAKRFDEALKIAKDNYDVVIQCDKECSFARDAVVNTFHHMFPELKESADEKMLQEIKRYIKEQGDKPTGLPNGSVAVADMLAWLEKHGETDKVSYEIAEKEKREFTSWKPSKEEMDVLYGLAYITNQYDEQKEEVLTRLYQDLKREFFNGSSYENMFPNTEDGVRRRSTIQVLEYARSLDNYNEYGKADIDKNIEWLEKHGNSEEINEVSYRMGIQRVLDNPESYGLEEQGEQKTTLPKWKYKKGNTPLLRDSLILNKYGCVAKSPSGALVSDVWVIDYDELSKLPKEEYEKQGEPKPDIGISSTTKQKLRDNLNKALEQETAESWNEFLDEQESDDKIQIGRKYKCIGSPRYTLFMKGDIYKPEDEFICSLMNLCSNCFEPIEDDGQKTADKVEPKFHVGDWCIDNEDGTIFQIVKVLDNTYTYRTEDGSEYSCPHYSLENDARLWTIQDAKDGDVLANKYGSVFIYAGFREGKTNTVEDYCYITANHDEFCVEDHEAGYWYYIDELNPATKEQRDLLFQKMKEAGYEWDAEKKELKKIEPKFHVGDCIVFNGLTLYIKEVGKCFYRACHDDKPDGYYWKIDNVARLWTIKDAKDGDVLTCNDDMFSICIFSHFDGINDKFSSFSCYCGLEGEGLGQNLNIYGYHDDSTGYVPATKEQRDQLEKAMHEAGYVFDFEKKEVKKIEENPAWSEEDENMLNHIIYDIEFVKKNVYCQTLCEEEIEWLKAIKDRVHKLSEKQELDEGTLQWIDAIIRDYEDLYKKDEDHRVTIQVKIDILKSLRDRYTCKSGVYD